MNYVRKTSFGDEKRIVVKLLANVEGRCLYIYSYRDDGRRFGCVSSEFFAANYERA